MNYLYFNIGLRITIGNTIQFTVCQSIKIEKSVQVLTDTAKLELPRAFKNAVDQGGKTVNIADKSILDFIKRGDSVKIEFGYDGDLQTEFEGYLSKIGADTPLLLECEDEMFQLKKLPKVKKYFANGRIKDILKAIIPSKYTIECNMDYKIGKWLVDATPFEVLDELRDKAGIRAYFKNPTTLCVGMIVDFEAKTIHEFNFSSNIRRGSSLKFEVKEDKPIFVEARSKQKKGNELIYTTGIKGGDTVTKSMPEVSLADLKIWADQSFKSKYFDGFRGSFDSWCYPRTKPGDSADLRRPFYKDKHQDGRYFIESVTIDVNNSDGIKRTNTLSYKL